VNQRAISAGALISLAAPGVAPGATIEPPRRAAVLARKRLEKTCPTCRNSAAPSRSAAAIAEAMVDADVVIRGVIEKGTLLTLTTDEALKHKVAEFQADSLEAALERLGIKGAELRRAAPNWAENVVRFLTHPLLSSLLVTIGMLGIIIELAPRLRVAIGGAAGGFFFWAIGWCSSPGGGSCCSRWAASRCCSSSSSSSRASASPASSASSPCWPRSS
jgi:membrane-bound serine protease (ClpP class)